MRSATAGKLIKFERLNCGDNDGDFSRIILDADPSSVVKRVDLRNDDIPIGEQTVAQVTNAIHQLFW